MKTYDQNTGAYKPVNIRNKIFCKTASLSTVATLQSCQKLDHFQIHNKIFASNLLTS